MNWGSVGEFFAMGGYGLYVWGAYAMTAVVVVWEILATLNRLRQARAKMKGPADGQWMVSGLPVKTSARGNNNGA